MSEQILKSKNNLSAYSGNVKITLRRGGIPIKVIRAHNYGTAEFFRYMLKCVSGNNMTAVRPGYIRLYKTYVDDSHNEPIVNFGILYDGTTEVTTGGSGSGAYAALTYNFLIPDTLVGGKTLGAFTIESMGDSGSRDTYAVVQLDGQIEIESDANVDIEWTITLENNSEEV